MKAVYSYKTLGSEVKDVDRKTRIVKGYFAAFGVKDSDGDIIRPGAFEKTIAENGPKSVRPRIKHLLNHSASQPLGKIIDLKEDGHGLLYTSEIGTHLGGEDFLKMVDSGLITEHSIGYRVMREEQDRENDTNYLNELKLWEGSSLTAWGANEYTPLVSAKGITVDTLADRLKSLEKFCQESTASDETIDLLLIQIKQMHQYIRDAKSAKSAKSAEPSGLNIEKSIADLLALFK